LFSLRALQSRINELNEKTRAELYEDTNLPCLEPLTLDDHFMNRVWRSLAFGLAVRCVAVGLQEESIVQEPKFSIIIMKSSNNQVKKKEDGLA
jgi:hypothetical protein